VAAVGFGPLRLRSRAGVRRGVPGAYQAGFVGEHDRKEESMEAMVARGATGRAAGLGTLAVGGGILLVAQAVFAALTEQSSYPNYAGTTGDAVSDVLFAAGLLVGLAAIEAVRGALAPRIGVLAMAGQAGLVVASLATVAANREALDLIYVLGTIAWLTGLVGVAASAFRSHSTLRSPVLALPPAAFAAVAFTNAGGAVLLGLVWLLLGARLRRGGDKH
jgi:hypothetical protein